MYYRPERFLADQIYGRVPPVAEVGGTMHTILDLSMSGIAVLVDDRTEPLRFPIGEDLPLKIRFSDRVFYDGRGKVIRYETNAFRPKLALQLTRGYLDVPGSVRLHREVALRSALTQGTSGRLARVDPQYRMLTADVVHLLRSLRSVLAEQKAAAPGALDESLIDDTLAACERDVLREWRSLWLRANELVQPLEDDPEAKLATKRFTELTLTPEFLDGAIWRRSYEKPLGYPGDFEVMNYVYRWRPEGSNSFGRLVHRLGLDVGEFIASRMVAVQHAITREIASQPASSEPMLIANLGAGPAQEVVNVLQMPKLERPVTFALIDQDLEALSATYERTYPLTKRSDSRAEVRCLHVSFTELLRSGSLFRRLQPPDMIYSIGLLDYLPQRRARRLIADLMEQLRPGGKLMIANMRQWPGSIIWPLEYIADWSLVYRTENEMRDLADGLDAESAEITTDDTKQAYLLTLRKRSTAS
ncbi:class I SAM-dependent methyltransferase family protein [Desertibaculum subflavum]|uniref:class I SAM-dependent methyltransferase family protein n=1 Tax=Desertibaculum subflavum TaxID=2268458 RepID=UPI000E66D0CD